MTFVLWTDEEEGVSLGGTFELFEGFAEITRAVAGRESEFGELLGVPLTADDTAPPEYVEAVARQAKALLSESPKLGDHARWLLRELAGPEDGKAFCPTGPGGGIDNSCGPGGSGSESPQAAGVTGSAGVKAELEIAELPERDDDKQIVY